jgi:hypothetical protein
MVVVEVLVEQLLSLQHFLLLELLVFKLAQAQVEKIRQRAETHILVMFMLLAAAVEDTVEATQVVMEVTVEAVQVDQVVLELYKQLLLD